MSQAVVIGAGVAGLTAAILLARRGYAVQVHERQPKPGGMLARYWRKGVPYETGFHYCGGVEPHQILGRCLVHLGVRDRLSFQQLDPDGFDRLVFPDFEFRVPAGREHYRARLKEAFPHEAVGIRAVVDLLARAVGSYGIYALDADVDRRQVLHWESTTLASVLDAHVRDPRLRAVLCAQCPLYGVPPHEAPFGLHAVVLDHFLQGAYRLRGGGDALALALVGRLEELGGRVHLRSTVTGIRVASGHVAGVEVGGEAVSADLVVSTMHPRLLLDLLPEGSVRPAYTNRVRGQKLGMGHFGAYLELDGPPAGIGNHNVYRFRSSDEQHMFADVSPRGAPFYFAATPVPSERPDGSVAHTLLLTEGLGWQAVAPWADSMPGRRPPEYLAFKAELLQASLETLFQDFPDLRGQVVRAHASTPLSTRFFTHSPSGAMYGHYHSVDQMGAYRLPQFIKVRGLLQAGQTVFAPGVLGAMLSAYYGCAHLFGFHALVEELKSA